LDNPFFLIDLDNSKSNENAVNITISGKIPDDQLLENMRGISMIEGKWTYLSDKPSELELHHMLAYARQNYASHTDWYLRHRDTGLKMLGVVLVANFTIGSLYYDHKLNAYLSLIALIILSILSLLLSNLSVKSCKQAYVAALENALLVTKTAWAMGFAHPIAIDDNYKRNTPCPAKEDEYLYVPRYIKDAIKAENTDAFVNLHSSKKGTTFFSTKWTLWAIGIVAHLVSNGLMLTVFLDII
jgi:hypothetical protein